MVAKGSHVRVHGRSGTEYILEGKVVARETSFPAIFYSISNTPVLLLNKFERGFPDNWIQLRDNWFAYARRQEEVPALIPELEQNVNHAPEGPVDTSTPHNEAAPETRHRRERRRESGFHQAQLAAILEGRENAGSSKVTERKRLGRSSQGPRAASKRRRSPSVPTRKSPRLERQVESIENSENEGHQMAPQGAAVEDLGNKSKEKDTVDVNGYQSNLQCTTCQFKAKKKGNFDQHLNSRSHKNMVALEVAAAAGVDSGTQSKVADETGKTVDSPQEENAMGGVPTFNKLNTSRASAREARTRCASMLKE